VHFLFEKVDALQLVPVLVRNLPFLLLSVRLELILQALILTEILDTLIDCRLVISDHLLVLLDLTVRVPLELFVLLFGVKFVLLDLLFEFFDLVVETAIFYFELVLFMGQFLNVLVFGLVV
jgi:hypothetical protein